MENKLVKFESQLEKVSNQIVITRKLLPDNLDYLKWWSDLDELWKTLLRTEIGLKITGVDLKAILRPDESEHIVKLEQLLPSKEIKEIISLLQGNPSMKYIFTEFIG